MRAHTHLLACVLAFVCACTHPCVCALHKRKAFPEQDLERHDDGGAATPLRLCASAFEHAHILRVDLWVNDRAWISSRRLSNLERHERERERDLERHDEGGVQQREEGQTDRVRGCVLSPFPPFRPPSLPPSRAPTALPLS